MAAGEYDYFFKGVLLFPKDETGLANKVKQSLGIDRKFLTKSYLVETDDGIKRVKHQLQIEYHGAGKARVQSADIVYVFINDGCNEDLIENVTKYYPVDVIVFLINGAQELDNDKLLQIFQEEARRNLLQIVTVEYFFDYFNYMAKDALTEKIESLEKKNNLKDILSYKLQSAEYRGII